jgi:hypothetical protein
MVLLSLKLGVLPSGKMFAAPTWRELASAYAPSGAGLVVVVRLVALVTAAAVGQVSAAGRLESIIPAQCLANIDFA